MEQMSLPNAMVIQIDFQRPGIPYTAHVLQPTLFKNGDDYCCALGPDPQSGVVGYGRTPEQAVQSWDILLTDRIEIAGNDDPLVDYVKDTLRRHAIGSEHNISKIEKGKASPVTRDAAYEDHKLNIDSEDLPTRRNTTDQSNVDGSEYV